MTQREERGYWRGLIRPIPRVASPAAEAGTLFHAWAEQFINAYGDGQSIDADGIGAYDSSSIETGTAGTCRDPWRTVWAGTRAGRNNHKGAEPWLRTTTPS